MREMKIYVHIKTRTEMFIATSFVKAKFLKLSKCPSIGEWTNKLWCIPNGMPLSNKKKEWALPRMNLEIIILREVSLAKKSTYHKITFYIEF